MELVGEGSVIDGASRRLLHGSSEDLLENTLCIKGYITQLFLSTPLLCD